MKYLKQFGIILLISFIGEVLHYLIPLTIPASIYGIVILFLCLLFHIIPVHAVKETSAFLIEIMPVMFIPAAVGLLESWDILHASLAAYAVVTFVSTCTVMIASGRITQAVLRHARKKEAIAHE